MKLTVDALVQDPLIRTWFVAGRSGAGRAVTWAHTCEMADPWNWMGSGDLLMTDGYSFPPEPSGQVEFLRQLAGADIVALALAENLAAPLSPEASAVADELAFPVLMTAQSVPFVTIARVVAERNSRDMKSRAAQVLRLYDIFRRSHAPANMEADLLAQLGEELGATLHIIDLVRGHELIPTAADLPEELRRAALDRAGEHDGAVPAFSRLTSLSDAATLMVPTGDVEGAALIVRREATGPIDLILAQHAAMIVGIEADRLAARRARARARGAALLRRMLEASISAETAAKQVQSLGLGSGPWRVTAWEEVASTPGVDGGVLSSELEHVTWPHLQLGLQKTHILLLAAEQLEAGLNVDMDSADLVVGFSQPITSLSRFADAVREARWAVEGARAANVRTAEYGSQGPYFLPRTVAEGDVIVRQLLGPIIDYDDANGAQLVDSLRVFFEANRSWQEGARRLGVHKQTLVYRMRKVEDLTGVSLRDFGGQAELYFALRTWRLLGQQDT